MAGATTSPDRDAKLLFLLLIRPLAVTAKMPWVRALVKSIVCMIFIGAMNLAAFDLNLLKVLDALLREHSTTRAGQRLGLSQPAVSSALGRLRQAFGDELFVRVGQGLGPTDFARSLEEPLRDVLDRLETMAGTTARWSPATADDVIRLSGIDFWSELLMPDLVRHVFAHAPGMRVQLLDLVPDATAEMLDEHRIDIALVPQTEMPSWIESRRLFWSPFVTIARQGHPRLMRAGLAAGETIPVDLFCDLPHVLLSPDGKLAAMGDAALQRLGRARRVAVTVPFFSGVVRLVAETDAIALIPQQYAEAKAKGLGLDLYLPPMPVPAALLTMIWHRRTSANPAHRWMRETIVRLTEPLNRGQPALPP